MTENEALVVKPTLSADATPAEKAEFIVRILDAKKARDICLLRVSDITVLTDYFVICSGGSSTQVKALADEIDFRLSEQGYPPEHVDGRNSGEWTVMDAGDVIVHVLDRNAREFYRLEKLWADAEKIDISNIILTD
ncbi:MAG: ribosome silencing factor [Clostridia bacterium]|nr:ribosome silencing factor [Clostridia bacterium]